MPTGVELIAAERVRQITEEGWTPGHDDQHDDNEMAWAALCYAAPGPVFAMRGDSSYEDPVYVDPWPWDPQWDKRGRSDRVRELVKAGALIAAEIDRLQRG